MADGITGTFPAEEPDLEDLKEMRQKVQELRLKLRNRSKQRRARCAAPATHERLVEEDRKEETGRWEEMEALREKHAALRQRRCRTSDIATLAQIERELCEVEDQLVGKKIAEGESATLAGLERVDKARMELEEASRELLASLHMQGDTADLLLR